MSARSGSPRSSARAAQVRVRVRVRVPNPNPNQVRVTLTLTLNLTLTLTPCGTDRASWPVLDIRAEVLTATTPMERLAAAKMGLVDSIYKLKGGNWPMSTYFWQ